MDNNSKEKNPTEIFKLFDKWAELLPKEGEQLQSGASFSRIGSEIKQQVSSMENQKVNNNNSDASTDSVVQETKAVKREVVSAPKENMKPNFLFELKSDDTNKSTEQQLSPFECVYDFCLALEKFCKSKSTAENRLDIDEDWKKLLFTCCSHNPERVMWIHLTFQTSNKMKLTWKQVIRRLMANFDDPKRTLSLERALSRFNFLPELESIYAANMEFARYADELGDDTKRTVELYLNGMPPAIKEVIESTIAYDESTRFRYSLLDVQQRSATFLTANEGDLIFYSKSAHLAIALEYEKVDTRNCEFHLLADHSTMECPDYTVLRFPYMDFTPLKFDLKPTGSITQDVQPTEDITMGHSAEPDSLPVEASPVAVKSEVAPVKPTQQTTKGIIKPQSKETVVPSTETTLKEKASLSTEVISSPKETNSSVAASEQPKYPTIQQNTSAQAATTNAATTSSTTSVAATTTNGADQVRNTITQHNPHALAASVNAEHTKNPVVHQKQPALAASAYTSVTPPLVKPQPSNAAPIETATEAQKTVEVDLVTDKKQRTRSELEKASTVVMGKIENSPLSPNSKAQALAKHKETIDKMLANHEKLESSIKSATAATTLNSAPQKPNRPGPDGVILSDAPQMDTPKEFAAWTEARKKGWPSKENTEKKNQENTEKEARGELPKPVEAASTSKPPNAQLPPQPPTVTAKPAPVIEPKNTEQAKASVIGQTEAIPSSSLVKGKTPEMPTGPAAYREKENLKKDLPDNQALYNQEKILSTTLAFAQKKVAASKPQAVKISVPSNNNLTAAQQANSTSTSHYALAGPSVATKFKRQPSNSPRRSRSRSHSPSRRPYRRARSRSCSYSRSRSQSRSRSRSSDRSYYRSKSPPRRRRRLSTDSPPRRAGSPATGCYIHGAGANHSTKDCRQAQLVIQPRKVTLDRQTSPPPIKRTSNMNGLKPNGEPNICIFCGLIFKPGHLQHCKKVLPRKKIIRRY